MRVNYTILTGIFLLILLYVFSGKVSAQTASSRPMSSVITGKIKQHLDLKGSSGGPANSITAQSSLPSGGDIPKQAVDARKKINLPVAGNAQARADELPSISPVNVEEIKRRNYEVLSKLKKGRQ